MKQRIQELALMTVVCLVLYYLYWSFADESITDLIFTDFDGFLVKTGIDVHSPAEMDNSAHINTIYTRHAHGMGPERVVSKAFRRIQLRGLFLGYIYIWHSCHFGVIRENELIVLAKENGDRA